MSRLRHHSTGPEELPPPVTTRGGTSKLTTPGRSTPDVIVVKRGGVWIEVCSCSIDTMATSKGQTLAPGQLLNRSRESHPHGSTQRASAETESVLPAERGTATLSTSRTREGLGG